MITTREAIDDDTLLVLARRQLDFHKAVAAGSCGCAPGKRIYWSKRLRDRLAKIDKSLHAELFGSER